MSRHSRSHQKDSATPSIQPSSSALASRPFAPSVEANATAPAVAVESANSANPDFASTPSDYTDRLTIVAPGGQPSAPLQQPLTLGASTPSLQPMRDRPSPPIMQRLAIAPLNPLTTHTNQPSHPQPQPQAIAFSNSQPENRGDTGRSLPIQPKLTIGAPNDKYEQEADRVAQQVVQRLSFSDGGQSANGKTPPPPNQTLQREVEPDEEDELQMKPLLQREMEPDEEDELQMKPDSLQREVEPDEEDELQMKPFLQRQGSGAVAASDDLESAIQQSRGGGQTLADSIREPMEQAFGGVDFSGVKVHTDGRSDQLNRSIQAKAFTTGQDIYFRQGAYEAGSRGGKELIAHELTHVVQQQGDVVQREDDDDDDSESIVDSVDESDDEEDDASNDSDSDTESDDTSDDESDNEEDSEIIIDSVDESDDEEDDASDDSDSDAESDDTNDDESDSEEDDASDDSDSDTESDDTSDGSPRSNQRSMPKLPASRVLVWSVANFENRTKADQPSQRSKTIKDIKELLDEYHTKYGSIASNDKQWVQDLKSAQDLLEEISVRVGNWLQDHEGDKSQNDRRRGMMEFQDSLYFREIPRLKAIEAYILSSPNKNLAPSQRQGNLKIIKAKHEGSARSALAKVGWLIDKHTPKPGDKSKLDFELKIPTDATATGFVGMHLVLQAERKKAKELNTRCELTVTVGSKFLAVAELKGELGGYFEAQAQNSDQVMTIISYALYRRFVESKCLPVEMSNFMWGGTTSSVGYKRAERWAGKVETDIFGKNDKAYGETGAIVGASARGGVNVGNVGLEGKIEGKYGWGTRYDMKAIQEGKKRLFKGKNKKGDLGQTYDYGHRGDAQKSIGRRAKLSEVSLVQ